MLPKSSVAGSRLGVLTIVRTMSTRYSNWEHDVNVHEMGTHVLKTVAFRINEHPDILNTTLRTLVPCRRRLLPASSDLFKLDNCGRVDQPSMADRSSRLSALDQPGGQSERSATAAAK